MLAHVTDVPAPPRRHSSLRLRAWRRLRAASLLGFVGALLWAPPALGYTAAPASARAPVTSENAAATYAYLIAINSFEETELANLPQSLAATEAASAQISGECPGSLTNAPPAEQKLGLGLESVTQPSARAEGERRRQSRQRSDLQVELSLALTNSRTEPDHEAAETLLRALTPLKWSNPSVTFLVHVTVEDIQGELEIPTPAVCTDMKTWVASGYKTLSPASKDIARRTEALLKLVFELVAVSQQTPIHSFLKYLAPYENAADKALAQHDEALTAKLKQGSETRADILKRLEATVGLPAPEAAKIEPKAKKPVVIGRGRTAAGGHFVVKAEPLSRSRRRTDCTVNVTISEPSHPQGEGLLEILSGEGTGRCLSRSHVDPKPAVHCISGLLIAEADLLPSTRSVRLLLSNGHTITSPAIHVPDRLGGPAGLYYQAVRGPSPIPVSMTELDAHGRSLAVLHLPAVVECTKNPVKYVPGGIVRLVHEAVPPGPAFTIRAERYRKLGTAHFELKLEVSNEEPFGGDQFETGEEAGRVQEVVGPGREAIPRFEPRAFALQTSGTCKPQPYEIVYGILKAPRDTVLARVSGRLVPLRKVAIPMRLHAGGVLAYGVFAPLPTELLIRNASGRTIATEDLSGEARSNTETCEGEAEG
jgi:hypothetical protein